MCSLSLEGIPIFRLIEVSVKLQHPCREDFVVPGILVSVPIAVITIGVEIPADLDPVVLVLHDQGPAAGIPASVLSVVRAVDPVVSFHIQGPAPNDHVSIGLQQVSFDLQGMAVQINDTTLVNECIAINGHIFRQNLWRDLSAGQIRIQSFRFYSFLPVFLQNLIFVRIRSSCI